MPKKKKRTVWIRIRECKNCGKEFNAFTRCTRVCNECKEENIRKLKEKLSAKALERRLKTNEN